MFVISCVYTSGLPTQRDGEDRGRDHRGTSFMERVNAVLRREVERTWGP